MGEGEGGVEWIMRKRERGRDDREREREREREDGGGISEGEQRKSLFEVGCSLPTFSYQE
jgi:hypothetical protein